MMRLFMSLSLTVVMAAFPAFVGASFAQTDLPNARVSAETLEQFEVGSFLESIVVESDGTIIFVDHESHTIYSKRPNGSLETLAQVDAELRGLSLDLDDTLFATGKQENGTETVFRLSHSGDLEPWVTIPDGRFLNGFTLLEPGVFLVADSFAGIVWRVDVRNQTVSPWLEHALTSVNPDMAQIPGPNGIKLYEGAAYLSNSAWGTVLRIPIQADGSAGEPEIFLENMVIDDFAFSADGDFYGTTHIFNTVVYAGQDGTRTIIAGPEEGVTGSTAVAFGVTPDDNETLYVVGDGGVFLPPAGGLVPAELVALDVGETGLSPIDALSWIERPETVPGLPTYLVQCTTAPGTDELRPLIGPSYLRYLELNADQIAFAGQAFDGPEAEGSPSARMYFTLVESAEQALAVIEASPYYARGLYASCDVRAFNALLGTLVGGVGWPEQATQPRQ